jgi:hypothetical protein
MSIRTLKSRLQVNLSNLPGWRTRRKIVVIESDDWGSIRTANREAYEIMKNSGLSVAENHYAFDSLESNNDLELLFDLLNEFKDSTGRPPVFTPYCNMANPDFQKIEDSDFKLYTYETLDKTAQSYPDHDRLLSLWKEGEKRRLFSPQLHGREHIHIGRWMQLLQSGDLGIKIAFTQRSVGPSGYNKVRYGNYLGALHPTSSDEIPILHEILKDAGNLFHHYMGHAPDCFVAPNAEEPAELAGTLKEIGVNTINRAKHRVFPLGDGKFKTEWNWPGKVNEYGQIILVRNAFFEPVCFGEKDKEHITDWVDNCLKEIEIAFRWRKPAVISSHRVNYIGFINSENREKGLNELRRLLKMILKKWPDVEFMTSKELSDLIAKQKNIL